MGTGSKGNKMTTEELKILSELLEVYIGYVAEKDLNQIIETKRIVDSELNTK